MDSLEAEAGSPPVDPSRYHRLTPISPPSDDPDDDQDDAASDAAVVGGDSSLATDRLGGDSVTVHPEYLALPPALTPQQTRAERSTVLADREVSFFTRTTAAAAATDNHHPTDADEASELSVRARDLLEATAYAAADNASQPADLAVTDAGGSFDYDSLRRDLASIQARLANRGYHLPTRIQPQASSQQQQQSGWAESRRLKWDYGADLGGRRTGCSRGVGVSPVRSAATDASGLNRHGAGFLSSPSPEYEEQAVREGPTESRSLESASLSAAKNGGEETAAAASAPNSARSQDTNASTSTKESTHTGSDDARPPRFPADAFGSRPSPRTPGPAAVGDRGGGGGSRVGGLYARSPRDPPQPEGLQAAWERFHRQGGRRELRQLRRVLADPLQALLLTVGRDDCGSFEEDEDEISYCYEDGVDVDDDAIESSIGGTGADATTAELQAALLRQRARLLDAVAAERRRRERIDILRRLIRQRRRAHTAAAMVAAVTQPEPDEDSDPVAGEDTIVDDALSSDRTDATQEIDEMTLPHSAARATAVDSVVAKKANPVAKGAAKRNDGGTYKLNGTKHRQSRMPVGTYKIDSGSASVAKATDKSDLAPAAVGLVPDSADDSRSAQPLTWFLPLAHTASDADATRRRQQRAAVLAARSRSRRDRLQSAAAARQALAEAEARLPKPPPLVATRQPLRVASLPSTSAPTSSAAAAARLERERREAAKRTNRLRKQIYGERLLRSVLLRTAER